MAVFTHLMPLLDIMFDLLFDHPESPKLMIFNSQIVDDNLLQTDLMFISMGLRVDRTLTLMNQRGVEICKIKTPMWLCNLPRDVMVSPNGTIYVIEWCTNIL